MRRKLDLRFFIVISDKKENGTIDNNRILARVSFYSTASEFIDLDKDDSMIACALDEGPVLV